MIQDMSTLHRFVRSVVAFSFRTHKKVSLGLSNTYSVNMWEGAKMTKATMTGTWVRRYNKAVFPLYSSFKGGAQGKTVNVDKRQNILANKSLWLIAATVIILGGASLYGTIKFFSPRTASSASASGAAASAPSGAAFQSAKVAGPEVSEVWRVSGSLVVGDKSFVVLVGESGRLRLEHPSSFQNAGSVRVGDLDGQRVTTWSGHVPTNTILNEVKN